MPVFSKTFPPGYVLNINYRECTNRSDICPNEKIKTPDFVNQILLIWCFTSYIKTNFKHCSNIYTSEYDQVFVKTITVITNKTLVIRN